jgi:hypothetical protein
MPGIPASVLYLRDIFGGDFEEQESGPTVGLAASRILLNDPEAISLTIINLGTADVYIKPSNTVLATSGILLTASGGNVSMDVRSDATLPSKEWWAISATAGQELYVLRIRRYVTFPA